jgi:hypothetical protein
MTVALIVRGNPDINAESDDVAVAQSGRTPAFVFTLANGNFMVTEGDGTSDAEKILTGLATGAAQIGIEDTATKITGTNVETALAELALYKYNLGLTTNANGASLVGIEDSGTLYTAANVEAALAEVKALADRAPKTRTVTFGFAALSGLGAGVKTYISGDASGALPAGARVLGWSIDTLVFFSDGGVGTYTVEFGVAGAADVMASTNVAAGAAPKAGTAASLGYSGAPATGTFSVKLTSSVDLNTTTAGSITARLHYFVPA